MGAASDDGRDGLRTEVRQGVAFWTLDRPERRNAIDIALARRIGREVEAVAEDASVRVVVLRGAGGNFSSGGDLQGGGRPGGQAKRSPAAGTFDMMMQDYGRAMVALQKLPKPTIAMVEGVAAGAGVNLALACDLVYAAEDSRFCEIFVRRALTVDCGGSWLLPRIVGLQKAKELAFFGEWLSAAEALDAGLVTAVRPPGELEAFVAERATTLASRSPVALSLIKQGMNRSFETNFADTIEHEATAQGLAVSTDDFKEGIKAFLEKREPEFPGG